MRTVVWLVTLLVLATLGGVVWLWVAQNADQTVTLGLDLGRLVGAWTMAEPVSAAGLVVGAFGAGAALVLLPSIGWILTLRRRVRILERQLGDPAEDL